MQWSKVHVRVTNSIREVKEKRTHSTKWKQNGHTVHNVEIIPNPDENEHTIPNPDQN
jgi:hypothetical protein